MKKGVLGDKCGSCNQYVQKDNTQGIINSPSNIRTTTTENSISIDNVNSKFQLKHIHDYSNRLGFGSYSRMISSNNSEIEELAKINFNNNINISESNYINSSNKDNLSRNSNSMLPEIQKRGGSNYNNRNSNQKEKLNNIIFNELDNKKRIKGEDLLKVVDKLT